MVPGGGIIRVTRELVRTGAHGSLYVMRDEAGAPLCKPSRSPEFDACRTLKARGIVGTLEVWPAGATFASMRVDIERGAELTICENARLGPRVRKYEPFRQPTVSTPLPVTGARTRRGLRPSAADVSKNFAARPGSLPVTSKRQRKSPGS